MSNNDSLRVLLVDDDQAILEGLCRQHRKHFALSKACGPEVGLQAITEQGPFAVVVSDYKMPGMNGAEFLERVRELAPDTTRIMLTGQADLATAVEAVNRGNIFRFLQKPCDPQLFRSVLDAGVEQYQLVNAERLLLEHTVKGSVEVLTDVLALANPAAFGRATRIQHYVKGIVALLRLPNAWMYETAALLSQIGCVAVPNDIFDRLSRGEQLPADQVAMLEKHSELARDMLGKIPRLQQVAEMVYHQKPDRATGPGVDKEVVLGGRILASVIEYDQLLGLGAKASQAMATLRAEPKCFPTRILDALSTVDAQETRGTAVLVPLRQLRPGMVLEEQIRTSSNNALLAPAGHRLTRSSLERLWNYGELGLLKKTEFRVKPESQRARPPAA